MDKLLSEKFICRKCGNCCRGSGFVKVTPSDIRAIADYLGLTEQQFEDRYTTPSLFEDYWLAEKPNRDCIFLEDNLCKIHPVKPEQCRAFPFSWVNRDTMETCPALKDAMER